MVRIVASLFALVLLVTSGAPSVLAKTSAERCQDGLAVKGAKFFRNHYLAISRCEERKDKGSLAPSVNCRPANGAVTDAKTQNKLDRAGDKTGPLGRPLIELRDGLSSRLRRRQIDLAHQVRRQAKFFHAQRTGPERIRLNNIRAGFQIGSMNVGELVRLRQTKNVHKVLEVFVMVGKPPERIRPHHCE